MSAQKSTYSFPTSAGSAGPKLPSRSGWRHPAQDQPLPGEYEASTPPPATFNSPLPPQQQPGTSEENVSPLIQRFACTAGHCAVYFSICLLIVVCISATAGSAAGGQVVAVVNVVIIPNNDVPLCCKPLRRSVYKFWPRVLLLFCLSTKRSVYV